MLSKFITDRGKSVAITDPAGIEVMRLPRYGVWGENGRGKPEVLETHDDLNHLQREHGVTDERVFLLKQRESASEKTD